MSAVFGVDKDNKITTQTADFDAAKSSFDYLYYNYDFPRYSFADELKKLLIEAGWDKNKDIKPDPGIVSRFNPSWGKTFD